MDLSSNLLNILLYISCWTNHRDFSDFFFYIYFWPTVSDHSVISQTSGVNKGKLRPPRMEVALEKMSAFLLDPCHQIKLLSRKHTWNEIRCSTASINGFPEGSKEEKCKPPSLCQIQSRWSLSQIPFNSTLIGLQNLWRRLQWTRSLYERDYYCQVSWNV